jgi:hypothetical protein
MQVVADMSQKIELSSISERKNITERKPMYLKTFLIIIVSSLIIGVTLKDAKANDLEVLYLISNKDQLEIPLHVQLAADSLGFRIISNCCTEVKDQEILERIDGLVVNPEILLKDIDCLRYLIQKLPESKPILITGLRSEHQEPLRKLGMPVTIESKIKTQKELQEVIVNPSSLASFFGGLEIRQSDIDNTRLILQGSEVIIGFKKDDESANFLVNKWKTGRETYLLTDTTLYLKKPLLDEENRLLSAMPYLIFFSKVGGDRVWQGSGLFANLTIDDPFLIEPYGSLSFEKLLLQMDAHRFHTTISFIPWNFDRNDKITVDLFKSRPDRFSVAIHGNNHDRKEFYSHLPKIWLEPYSAKSFEEHKFNLSQAIIRMNEFRQRTGIPYDRVLIFPQEIGPAISLKLSKDLGYIATINGSNVPIDMVLPQRAQMSFRPYNNNYFGFLSLRRVRVNTYSEFKIRAELFLGNPLYLYSHHDLFEPGIGAFNPVADLINKLCPRIKWESLGKIISQWYLWRRTGSSAYEVKLLAPIGEITNDGNELRHYDILKIEDSNTRIQTILINGVPVNYESESDWVKFRCDLRPGASANIEIRYAQDIEVGVIGLNDGTSYMVYLWRGLAEFRDRILSKFFIGRYIRDQLYETGIATWLPQMFISLVIIVSGFVFLLKMFIRNRIKRI